MLAGFLRSRHGITITKCRRRFGSSAGQTGHIRDLGAPRPRRGCPALRRERSGIARSRVAKRLRLARCGLWRSWRRLLLHASGKSPPCSQRGALGLLLGCLRVALSLRGRERSWTPSGASQWQRCHGHEKMQRGGKGLQRKGGRNVSPESRHASAPCGTIALFQPLTPHAAARQQRTGNMARAAKR